MLLALAVSAPVSEPLCRVRCEAASAAKAPVETTASDSCHAAAPEGERDSQSSGKGTCEHHARSCEVSASSETLPMMAGAHGGSHSTVAVATSSSFIGLDQTAGSPAAPRPFASPPFVVPFSVLRL
jgi:hypothetical protein